MKCVNGEKSGRVRRYPPLPADDPRVVEAWIATLPPEIQSVVRSLDALISETLPGYEGAIKWRKA